MDTKLSYCLVPLYTFTYRKVSLPSETETETRSQVRVLAQMSKVTLTYRLGSQGSNHRSSDKWRTNKNHIVVE